MRLQANRFEPFGLDESFDEVTGTGGGVILAYGGIEGWTTNWDDGIDGEAAFAGAGGGDVFGSVSVRGGRSSGQGGTGAGLIVVDSISLGPGAGWYAGLVWSGQVLPSDDLSQVFLTADIRGTAISSLGQSLGSYALRLEDADLDWLTFDGTASGQFQTIGGALDSAAHGGFGDGTFDPERGPFSVVIVMHNDSNQRWDFGGQLRVDNLFLSGGFVTKSVGSVSYSSEVTSGFESVGGLVANGDTTFVNVDEDFELATGQGAADFFDAASGSTSWAGGWDLGIEGEAAFAGYWGNVQMTGLVSAYTDLTGGPDGGAAGVLEASGLNVQDVGGWWAGLMWQDQTLPDLPLEEIFLTANIKGNIPGGLYHLRIEDADNDYLAFTGIANGNFQSIGGPLSDAVEGTFIGDGTFHLDHGPFTVVVAFFDEANTWDTGGRLVVDDLFMTAPGFGAGAEEFAAVVAFTDEVNSWGLGGTLIVDDLSVAMITSDVNEDGVTDLRDVSHLQACFSGTDGVIYDGCLPLDSNGNGDIDAEDFLDFSVQLGGPS